MTAVRARAGRTLVRDAPGLHPLTNKAIHAVDNLVERGTAAGAGSGLGLAIVDEVVRQYGGTVELGEGEGGMGLRATVRLPLARAAVPVCARAEKVA